MPRKKTPATTDEAIVKVASTKDVPSAREKKLLEEIAALQAQVSAKDAALDEVQAEALKRAEAQGALMQRQIEEVPTGKTTKVQKLKELKVAGHKDDGREILKPIFRSVEVPTWYYKIDLPPVGGDGLKINDVPLYHGAVYEFDIDTLRTVKEMVFRCWKHEADIRGSDENFYRKPQHRHISMGAR